MSRTWNNDKLKNRDKVQIKMSIIYHTIKNKALWIRHSKSNRKELYINTKVMANLI